MTAWSPVYRVKVNGSTVTGATLSGLTITSGRTDIYAQANAGYCNLTLIETAEAAVPFEINDAVTIEVPYRPWDGLVTFSLNSAFVLEFLCGALIFICYNTSAMTEKELAHKTKQQSAYGCRWLQ